jgi:hypothetical protein
VLIEVFLDGGFEFGDALEGAQQLEEVQSALRAVVPNQAKCALPICVQKPFVAL